MNNMTIHSLKILQVASHELAGGAARIAWSLNAKLIERGYASTLVVGTKRSDDDNVLVFDNNRLRNPWSRNWYRIEDKLTSKGVRILPGAARGIGLIGEPRRALDRFRGIEDFHYPATKELPGLKQKESHLIHLHNLHGQYFDLRMLPQISNSYPTLITLHDEWMYTGHCAYTLDCERWRIGCGSCPDLNIYPSIRLDKTVDNLKRKSSIFNDSRLWITAPSKWLMDKAKESVLQRAMVQGRVIRNGVDLEIFKPNPVQERLRKNMGIPVNSWVVLFVGFQTKSHPFKDYSTMAAAVSQLPVKIAGREVVFVCLGEKAKSIRLGNTLTMFAEGVPSAGEVTEYYNASDVYIHAARADTYPTTILEAMACGLPVVATSIGGIPEQVENDKTGFLVPPGDAVAMSARLLSLLSNSDLLDRMGNEAERKAKIEFGIERMMDEYIALYSEIADSSGEIA